MAGSTKLDRRMWLDTMFINTSSKKRKCSTYITKALIADILSRLPVKSIVRFRCACKSWPVLTSNPQFVSKHQSRAIMATNSTNSFKLFVSAYPLLSIEYNDGLFGTRELAPPVVTIEYVRILGSCNGMVCLEVDDNSIVLWNPSTRDTKVLPKPPSDNHELYGFGYDSKTEDYKVIRGSTVNKETVIEVFSLKSNSWRVYEESKNVSALGMGCLFNGALHWAELGTMSSQIISFDLADEKFKEMVPLPTCGNRDCIFVGIGTSRSRLFIYTDPIDNAPFTIWIMEKYGVQESWTRVLQVSSKILADEFNVEETELFLKPVYILENGEVLLNYDARVLVLYNPQNRTFEDITEDDGEDDCFEAAVYVETLVSPVIGSGADM